MANNGAILSRADRQSIEQINTFLQRKLAVGLEKKFGRSDQTVLEMVRTFLPSKTLYINNHDNGIKLYDESDYFDTLSIDDAIGYQKWDGAPGEPSVYKMRRAYRMRTPNAGRP